MFNRLKALLRALVFRRTIRTIKHPQKESWYPAELLRTMLKGELRKPDQILLQEKGFGGGVPVGK